MIRSGSSRGSCARRPELEGPRCGLPGRPGHRHAAVAGPFVADGDGAPTVLGSRPRVRALADTTEDHRRLPAGVHREAYVVAIHALRLHMEVELRRLVE